MATGTLPRGLAILQTLVGSADGLPLTKIADDVDLPKSAAHRILLTLIDEGFVQQNEVKGTYALTLRIVSLGLRHLASSTVFELALPILSRLAAESGQLVRLGLVDGQKLVWVARTQGARAGLRYDPDVDHGSEIPLATSASGLAWLSGMSDDDAVSFVARQEIDLRHEVGHNAPTTLTEVLALIHDTRTRGWARVHDSVEEGISAMAVPIADSSNGRALGVVSIAGPSLQLTDAKMDVLAPGLHAAAVELSGLAGSFANDIQLKSHFAGLSA
ncbi:IclR family transcriptional regulator [Rhodococcoides kyotonense]|uniref:Glycerol operon regulatory protein n=1 Tax=Rhodococcoides kyotonense TaxID=398843 RepID=A0A239N3C2_9NOCA|nr:IclR family transcriptional regulator [Rhodococcus kyotonensis]SNT48963.1 DNA-binding transcriptional regulator, IclR family [Rhodococcus kyotonensis]